MQLLEEQLFCDMYATLDDIAKEYNEPSPAELWDEAAVRWKPLLASKRPQLHVPILKAELTEEYGERATFLIMMILMYMMVAMFRPTEDSPYYEYCASLADATQGHPLLQRFWEGVRKTEDEEERAGRKIRIVTSLLTEIKAAGESIDFDTLERHILQFPTFESQQTMLRQADDLLRGTSWSQRSAEVQKKIIAQAKEQKDRMREVEDKVIEGVNQPKTVYESGATHNDRRRQIYLEAQSKSNKQLEEING